MGTPLRRCRAAGGRPQGITYRRPTALGAGSCPIRFDYLVDHLSQQILHQRSTAALLEACCKAVGAAPRENGSPRKHAVMQWDIPRLLTTFLDSPDFYLR